MNMFPSHFHEGVQRIYSQLASTQASPPLNFFEFEQSLFPTNVLQQQWGLPALNFTNLQNLEINRLSTQFKQYNCQNNTNKIASDQFYSNSLQMQNMLNSLLGSTPQLFQVQNMMAYQNLLNFKSQQQQQMEHQFQSNFSALMHQSKQNLDALYSSAKCVPAEQEILIIDSPVVSRREVQQVIEDERKETQQPPKVNKIRQKALEKHVETTSASKATLKRVKFERKAPKAQPITSESEVRNVSYRKQYPKELPKTKFTLKLSDREIASDLAELRRLLSRNTGDLRFSLRKTSQTILVNKAVSD